MRQISYQLFSSRHFHPVTDTLRMLSEYGYAQVEGYSGLFRTGPEIAELKSGLKAFGLSMPTAHFSLDRIQAMPEKIIAIAEAFEIRNIIIPDFPLGRRLSSKDDWADLGTEISVAAKPLRAEGIHVSYHNHDVELFDLVDGGTPLSTLLDADPDLYLEFDVAWAHKARTDPAAEIARFGSRIKAVHIKDVAQAGQSLQEEGWADIGQGILGWTSIWNALNKEGIYLRVVEHNSPADHWRFAKRSMQALRDLDMPKMSMS